MDGVDQIVRILRPVGQLEEAQFADQMRAQILRDEGVVAELRPGGLQRAHDVAVAGDLRQVVPVLVGRIGNDALDVAHHLETERIGIDAGEAGIVEIRLGHDVGVAGEEFEHAPKNRIKESGYLSRGRKTTTVSTNVNMRARG